MRNNPDTRKVSMLEDLVKPLCLKSILCLRSFGGQATQGGQASLKYIQFCILSLGIWPSRVA
jgi:hypothetical protein